MSLLYLARSGTSSGKIRPKMFPGQGPCHHMTQHPIPGSEKGERVALCTRESGVGIGDGPGFIFLTEPTVTVLVNVVIAVAKP